MSYGQQLKYALGVSFYISFYTIASLLVLYVGPQLGLGLNYQIVLIALILLTWPFAAWINHRRKRKAEGRKESSGQPREAPAPAARAYGELTRGAEEVAEWLRSTKLATSKKGDAVYSLPWFMVAGPLQSGKTALLLSAGLDFQALPSQRHGDQNLIRPTRDCQWRVTDSMVLLDTAGRYLTEGPDQDEWLALIDTVKKHRQVRPLDGLLIVADAMQLLASGEAQIEQQAKLLRARLDQVIERARSRFPVYLVFTHLDRVEGFDQFFDALDRRERAEVWGATIPLEQSQNAHALFDVEFDYLYDTLVRHRLLRLAATSGSENQLSIFDFPIYFGQVRSKLGLFTSTLFRANPFSETPLLRGFYFTGSPTAGARQAKPSNYTARAGEERETDEARVAGDGYFTEHFFYDVLLRDKDLAASFQAGQKHPHRQRNALLAAAAALLLFFTIGMAASFVGNRALMAEALERGRRNNELARAGAGKDRAKLDAAAWRVELEAVDDLRRLVSDLDDFDRSRPPLFLTFGFYSGNQLNPYLRPIYFDAINASFCKSASAALERDLRAFAKGSARDVVTSQLSAETVPAKETDPHETLGHAYDLLKAYLMLSNPDKVEPTFLANQLMAYWRKSPPPDLQMLADEQVKFYASQASRTDAPGYKADDQLVVEARRKLVAYPAVNRFFKQMTGEIDLKVASVSLDAIAQGRGRGVVASSYAVPGSFTITGLRDHWDSAMESAAEQMGKDDWVMGPQAPASNDPSADVGKLQSIYFREYTAQWQKFINGISIRAFNGRDDAVEAFKALSSADSPMELLLIEIERHTNLSAKEPSRGFWAWLKGRFSSRKQAAAGNTDVENEFRPLFAFVQSEGKKDAAPISQYRAALRRVLDALESKSDDQLAQTAKALLTGKDEIGLQKAEQEVSRLLDSFKTAATSDVAKLLKQPLNNLRAMFYGGGYEQIEKAWRDQLYPKAHALEAGLPFTDSTSQTPVTDLARYLNPANGQFTQFFNDRLATSFEDVQGEWKLKESGAVKLADGFVRYLNAARRLREALFAGGGQQPEVSYEIILQPIAGTDVVIEIDGNRVETRGATAQSAKFIWPARSGASGARILVMQAGTPAEKSFPGEWGLFKMFAAGNPTKTAENQFQVAWTVGAATVRAVLRPSSATNPFERKLFAELRAPQGLN